MAKKKAVKKEENNNEYTFTLRIANDVFTSSDVDALTTLRNLPKPQKIVHRGVLLVEQNGKKKEIYLTVDKLKRLYYPIAQKILIKHLVSHLK